VEKIRTMQIQSTSKHSATCSDIELRSGDRVRLLFRPELVDNRANELASVRGTFVYQKKLTNGRWTDADRIPLSSLKSGEGFQLTLAAGELFTLFQEVVPLYRFYRKEGVPSGAHDLLKVRRDVSQMLSGAEHDLADFLVAHPDNPTNTLRALLHWISRQENVGGLVSEGDDLPELNSLLGLANLHSILKEWNENADSADEDFWQGLFSRHTYVLSQVFSYPVIFIKGKAYAGGKDLTNAGGNVVDFLFKTESSGAAVLIEIKTPKAQLLGSKYRDGAYPPSSELGGAISQVLEYSETLSAEFHSLNTPDSRITLSQPYSLIIIGNAAKELTDDAKCRSFERFRERMTGVRVLTFDEVFRRIEGLISLLEG